MSSVIIKFVVGEKKDKKERKSSSNKEKENKSSSERPLGIKLILAYNILHLFFIFYSMISGYGGIAGILYILALYYGLWKMKKDWMYLLIFGMIASTVYYLYQMFAYTDVLSMTFGILNAISVYWLYSKRSIFIEERKKGKSVLGTKSEWIRVGLVILGIICIPITIAIINFDYMLYGILSIPIWIIFVWFLLPRIFNTKKK